MKYLILYMVISSLTLTIALYSFARIKPPASAKTERFPIQNVPPEVFSRANEYSTKNRYEISYFKTELQNLYTIQVTVPRRSQKMPHWVTLEYKDGGELSYLAREARDELFQKSPMRSYRCKLIIMRMAFSDYTAVTYLYS